MKHHRHISMLRALPVIVLAAALLNNCAVPAGRPAAAATPQYDDQIRLDGLKRGKATGHNPVIVFMTPRGTIGIARGSVFSEGASGWEPRANDLLINAGNQPVTVMGASLGKGEAGLIRGGQCRKISARFGGVR